ncbi:MAG: LemA family protein [Candidatus Omnitrophota bacterium]
MQTKSRNVNGTENLLKVSDKMRAVFILFGVFLLVLFASVFNRLVSLKNFMLEAFSGIDVQLKRRHDLIPNIVDCVKAYAHYESKLLEDVTSLRVVADQKNTVKEKGCAENGISEALKSIFAVAEAYPELKANENFLGLQNNLIEIEDQIQMARRYYNGTVRNYNTGLATFPNIIIARLFHFQPADFFEIDFATQRKAPEARFKS